MASDLDFSHSVREIPPAEKLPTPYGRHVTAETNSVPDIQGAATQYGRDTNWMSAVGSYVASKASNAMAQQIGTELGKKPQGNLGIPLTEFDQVMQKSYQTQSAATLGLQAQKLITDSNIEMAKMPRLNPQAIAKTNKSISIGLQNIFQNAPAEVRSQLEYQYGHVQLNQYAQLNERMIGEQREDQHHTTLASSQSNSENAYSLSIAGNSKAADAVVENTRKINEAALAAKVITPEQAKVNIDTARQSAKSGQLISQYEQARKEGKGDDFLKKIADSGNTSDKDYMATTNNLMQYVNHQQGLRNQAENYQVQLMNNRIATDPTSITGADWNSFSEQVSPIKMEETRFRLIQAMKSKSGAEMDVNGLIANYGDAEAQANATPKIQNAAFYKNVQTTMSSSPSMTKDQAEVQVAMSAGATVPVFTQTLKNKLWSGDPVQMDSAARQIHELQELNAGHALHGLNDSDLALFGEYEGLRNPADPTAAAKMVIANSQNLDPTVLGVTKSKWQTLVDKNTRLAGRDVDEWVLGKFGFNTRGGFFSSASFDSPFLATTYSADILAKYKSFYESSRGNDPVASKLTQDYVNANYGHTSVNGSKQWTLHPIEKTIGFNEGDGIPSIHRDMIRQFQEPMAKLKEAYNNGSANEYWEIKEPVKGQPLKFIKHERAEFGTTTKEYNASLLGTNFDQWDVAIDTQYGPRNIFLESPMLGIMTYTPDRKWIKDDYAGRSHEFPEENVRAHLQNLLTPGINNNG